MATAPVEPCSNPPTSLLETRSTLCAMSTEGDFRFQWNRNNPEEVKAAEAEFKKYKGQGFTAYRTQTGAKDEILHAFDPNAERIIMAPPPRGG